MPLKEWRINKNICTYPSSLKDFNFDTLTNIEVIPIFYDDNILIWLDASIHKENPDDQRSINQLRLVINSIVIFTDEQACLKFINKFKTKNKLLVIVSGSLGQSFVPKIDLLLQIYSIYVFCGKKINHESWAQKYPKVKGVFDVITDLCEYLKRDKEKLEADRLCQRFIDLLPKQSLSLNEFNNHINFNNSKYNHQHHQAKDDIKITVKSADIPFSKEDSCLLKKEVEVSNNIPPSETVAPVVQYKQHMEFSDTGIWPCVSVIDSARNELFNHLHSVIGIVQYFNSIENCLQHVHNHCDDPQLIVICNPTNTEHVLALSHLPVRKVYIYSPNNHSKQYYALSERYPTIFSVIQHIDSLTRLILWDLSACIVDIGNYYDRENKKNLAQTRYRYAYRLHLVIREDLNNRIEMME